MRAFDENYISRRDAVIAAGIAALLGGVAMAMLLTGSRIPLKCFDAGDASNWLAAAGTWVIGYGAWKYARQAHVLRRSEVEERANEEKVLRARRLTFLISKANLACKMCIVFPIQENAKFNEMTPMLKAGNIDILEGGLGRIVWAPEDVAKLPKACQDLVENIEITIMQARQYIKLSRDEQFLSITFYNAIAKSLTVLGREAKTLKGLIEAERDAPVVD